ncbi:hypothetical protein OSTOST_17884 [Ostertagia ostertagi]
MTPQDIRANRAIFSTAEPTRPQLLSASTTTPTANVEAFQAAREVDRSDPPKGQTTVVPTSDKDSSAPETQIPDRRVITFQEPQQLSQAQTVKKESPAQATPAQQPSVYQKVMGLFGNNNTSDTDDDISLQTEPPKNIIKPQVSVPVQPVVQQSSAGMLSHYLAAATSTTKNDTPSDSDDDFFK